MVLVLVASMCTPWPHMPVDPRTVAGMMYYVAGSEELLGDVVEGRRREAEWIRNDGEEGRLRGRYFYGRVEVGDGKGRMGVGVVG